jgi:hypothetical protein
MHTRKVLSFATLVALGLLFAAPARAGDDDPMAQHKRMTALIQAFADYSKEVRLGESDIQKIIEVSDSFEKLDKGDNKDWIEKAYVDGKVDLSVLFKDEKYAAWAKENGVDPAGYFGKMTRLQLLHIQTAQLEQMESSLGQIQQQMAMIESMKEHMGEEAYQQAKQQIQAAAAMLETMVKTLKDYPKPSDAEKALLEKYAKPLAKVYKSGEEEEEEDEGMEDGEEDEK